MPTISEALINHLEQRGVDYIFGIPGVHTIELYRGLAASSIRHITPRHEQGAGFMADGYARVSGKPGVAFVITGPGLTNTLTAMGQARADSVPVFVVSGVNTLDSLGKGLGHLHELPDQQALVRCVALKSQRVESAAQLHPALDTLFSTFSEGCFGPIHLEIPLDVAAQNAEPIPHFAPSPQKTPVPQDEIDAAVALLKTAQAPVILAGGGARGAAESLKALAEQLDAPVVQTVNARGIMFDHPLGVPASPSLNAVRDLIEGADVVLAIGTELGQTDYDMYATGTMPSMTTLIRVDSCAQKLQRSSSAHRILGDAAVVVAQLQSALKDVIPPANGAQRAAKTRADAFEEIGPQMRDLHGILTAIREALPQSIIVGDSAYPIYAGNLYYDHDRIGGWFNAATGFGALGYGIPAAIGAALAAPDTRILSLSGDGGAQFSLPEIMCAVDENLPITFAIWNNHGYQEIATSMQDVGATVIGCDPTPPDFEHMAKAYGIPYWRCSDQAEDAASTLREAAKTQGPSIVEIRAPNQSKI